MLVRALVALALGALLLVWSVHRLRQLSTVGAILQSIGAAGVLGVAGTHLCELFRFFPAMGWGEPHSIDHYFDLVSALIAATLLPAGFAMTVWRRSRP